MTDTKQNPPPIVYNVPEWIPCQDDFCQRQSAATRQLGQTPYDQDIHSAAVDRMTAHAPSADCVPPLAMEHPAERHQ
jgi:hypothetical protein